MPKFFFNVRDGRDVKDAEGMLLPDVKAARLEGIKLSGAILKDEADQFDEHGDWKLEVTDETGFILVVMTFSIIQSSAVLLPWDRRAGN